MDSKDWQWQEVMTEQQLAKFLDIPKASLENMRRDYGAPSVRVGRQVCYLASVFLQWLLETGGTPARRTRKQVAQR